MNASVRLSVSSLRAHTRRFAGTFLAVFLKTATARTYADDSDSGAVID